MYCPNKIYRLRAAQICIDKLAEEEFPESPGPLGHFRRRGITFLHYHRADAMEEYLFTAWGDDGFALLDMFISLVPGSQIDQKYADEEGPRRSRAWLIIALRQHVSPE